MASPTPWAVNLGLAPFGSSMPSSQSQRDDLLSLAESLQSAVEALRPEDFVPSVREAASRGVIVVVVVVVACAKWRAQSGVHEVASTPLGSQLQSSSGRSSCSSSNTALIMFQKSSMALSHATVRE